MSSNEIHALLLQMRQKKCLFIGLGNPWRGDDGAGLFLVDLLQRKFNYKNFFYLQAAENPENYLGEIKKIRPEVIIFFDAARLSGETGEIKLIKRDDISTQYISTHTYGLSILLTYLEKIMKCRIYVVGIQGKEFALSDNIMQISKPLQEKLLAFVEGIT